MLSIGYCLVRIYCMSLFERYELKWFIVWLTLAWGWVGFVWYLSLTTTPPEIDLVPAFNDKVGHLIAYAWLMFWFGNLYHNAGARLFYAGLFISMGIGLEFLQAVGQVRQFEYYDMLANSAGVFVGVALLLTPLAKLLFRIECIITPTHDNR